MIIKNTPTYNVLKYLQRIVLPAIAVLYEGLAKTWGLPYVKEIPVTIMYIVAFLGSILEISSANFKLETQTGGNAFVEAYDDFANGLLEDGKEKSEVE